MSSLAPEPIRAVAVGTTGCCDGPGTDARDVAAGTDCPGTSGAGAAAADSVASDVRRAVLARRIRLLVAATISYNVVEAVVAISAGTVASSAALIGFGLDSVIEVASATAVAW